MAAAVAAMAAEAPANDATVQPTTAVEDAPDDKSEQTVSTDTQPADEPTPDAPAVSFESMKPGDALPAPNIDSSASRRFAMLKKMNTPPAVTPPVEPSAPPEQEAPELTPIENQFGLSMTQTLAQLKFEKPDVEDESESGQSGGFLSRFKRS
jgi:hypothetical protein